MAISHNRPVLYFLGSEYEQLGASIGKLVAEKQAAYGDAFGKSGDVLRILYPGGIGPE